MAFTIGTALRVIRTALDLSQAQAVATAHKSGFTGNLSADMLSKFERGDRDPQFEALRAFLTKAYGVEVRLYWQGQNIDDLIEKFIAAEKST